VGLGKCLCGTTPSVCVGLGGAIGGLGRGIWLWIICTLIHRCNKITI